MDIKNFEIAQRIKEKRIEKKITQRGIANFSGITASTYNKIEAGGGMKVEVLLKFSECLDTPIEYFIHGEVEQETQMIVVDADSVDERLHNIEKAILLLAENEKKRGV